MKKLTMLMVLLLLVAAPALALTTTFGDSSIHWPGWESGNPAWDTDDDIGSPELSGGGAVTNDGELRGVYFDWHRYSPIWIMGDLFVDVGANKTWDYILRGGTQYHVKPFSLDPGPYYHLSTFGRIGHPWRANLAELDIIDTVDRLSYTAWAPDLGEVEFGTSIDLDGKDFIIAFGPSCANDIIYERVSVPEPSVMLLFGAFLVAMATVGRKGLKR